MLPNVGASAQIFSLSCFRYGKGRVSRRFEFHKRSQLFIRTPNESLSVAAIMVQALPEKPATK